MKPSSCLLVSVLLVNYITAQNSTQPSIGIDGTNMCSKNEGCLCDNGIQPVAIHCEGMGLQTMYEQSDWLATFEALNISSETPLQLSFEDNAIKELPRFPPMAVEILILRRNKIESIDRAAFVELKQLKILDLSRNHLNESALLEGVFFGKFNKSGGYFKLPLIHLNLSHNGIHSLDKNAFDHMPDLTSLDVSHNPLRTLDGSTSISIASLRKLENLYLTGAGITSMHEGMLHDLKFLAKLDLSGNLFVKVPPELGFAHQLKSLRLDGNKFETLDKTSFAGLEYLEVLSLVGCERLKTVEEGAFGPLKALKKLDMSHCKRLETLSDGAFQGIVKDNSSEWPVKEIRLNDNGLVQIDEVLAKWDDVTYIDIQNNPFRCDCNLEWMVNYLLPKIEKIQPGLSNEINCAHPKALKGKSLVHLMAERDLFSRCRDSKDELFPEEISLMQSSSYGAAVITIMIIGCLLCIVGVAGIILAVLKRRAIARALVDHQQIRYERADSDDDGSSSLKSGASLPVKNKRYEDF